MPKDGLTADIRALYKKKAEEELLVFGYSCKLFRDDEKAIYIDQKKHLIPWMGDETLQIDRYDVRGALADLRPYEPENLHTILSESERLMEQLCDGERYRALHRDEDEEVMYREEEAKRLAGKAYGQVSFAYDEPGGKLMDKQDIPEEEDEPFVPVFEFPASMTLPSTVKLNTIIERTAMFISQQGPQMEILLRTKQASNPQFQFLTLGTPLHPYYQHLLMLIKTGHYHQVKPQRSEDEHYLHPTLAGNQSRVELAPSVPSISYKPSPDCAYSMLVSEIKTRQAIWSDAASSSQVSASNEVNESPLPSVLHQEDSNSSHESVAPPLSENLQVIIDKMAKHVAKNGKEFEELIRTRNEHQFEFLNPAHYLYSYYCEKVQEHKELEQQHRPAKEEAEPQENLKISTKQSGKTTPTPVCFSIRKPKNSENVLKVPSALLVDGEDSLSGVEDGEQEDEEMRAKEKLIKQERKRRAAAFLTHLGIGLQAAEPPFTHAGTPGTHDAGKLRRSREGGHVSDTKSDVQSRTHSKDHLSYRKTDSSKSHTKHSSNSGRSRRDDGSRPHKRSRSS
ncbi:splicing factor, suppressor of white-apricot homolog [Bacillus rossius redtenbacheri]|uniref:splicing factor, suppressor of white-apricot homolog n=1 Tax=Bacillus rossius redtenbacheri TaxID=93214 RepID=UPI002FDD38FA